MWAVSTMECDYCGYRWVSVAPDECEWLECAICHKMNPVPYEATINDEGKNEESQID